MSDLGENAVILGPGVISCPQFKGNKKFRKRLRCLKFWLVQYKDPVLREDPLKPLAIRELMRNWISDGGRFYWKEDKQSDPILIPSHNLREFEQVLRHRLSSTPPCPSWCDAEEHQFCRHLIKLVKTKYSSPLPMDDTNRVAHDVNQQIIFQPYGVPQICPVATSSRSNQPRQVVDLGVDGSTNRMTHPNRSMEQNKKVPAVPLVNSKRGLTTGDVTEYSRMVYGAVATKRPRPPSGPVGSSRGVEKSPPRKKVPLASHPENNRHLEPETAIDPRVLRMFQWGHLMAQRKR